MLISRLKCRACTFASDAFGDTCDIHDATYSFVFQNRLTNELTVEEIPSAALEASSIDLDAHDAQPRLHEAFSTSQKRLIEIPVGQDNAEVEAVCPQCGSPVLIKVIIGFQ